MPFLCIYKLIVVCPYYGKQSPFWLIYASFFIECIVLLCMWENLVTSPLTFPGSAGK